MKNLKAFVTVVAFGLLSTITIQAQEKPASNAEQKQDIAKQNQENRDRLALTKEQQTPYREIIKKYTLLLREVKASALSQEAKNEKIAVLATEKDAEIKTLFTPEQFKIYQTIQAERKSKTVPVEK